MVARPRLLQHLEMSLEVLFGQERRSVDPREHLVALVAAPVRARDGQQLERLDAAGRRSMRAAAQVGEGPVPVERDGRHPLVCDQVTDELDLVVLILGREALLGLGDRKLRALERLVRRHVLAHPLLDAGQVLVRDLHPLGKLEVVVEAVLDRRADRDLGPGIELHHGGRHHVRRVVADQVEGVRAAIGNDLHLLAVGQRGAEIRHVPVDPHRERGLRQAGADVTGQVGARRAVGQLLGGVVGECDLHHA